jgi:hypothetical protein
MKKIYLELKTIDKKRVLLLVSFTMGFSSYIHLQTKEKLENGYEFFLSFFPINLFLKKL